MPIAIDVMTIKARITMMIMKMTEEMLRMAFATAAGEI